MSPFYQDSNDTDMIYSANAMLQASDDTVMSFPISSSFSEGMSYLARSGSLFGSPSTQSPPLRPRRRERTPEACMDSIPGEQTEEEVTLEKQRRFVRRRHSSQIPVPHYSNILSGHEKVISLSKDEYSLLQHGDYVVSRKQRSLFRSYSGNDCNVDTEAQAGQEERVRPSLRRRWRSK